MVATKVLHVNTRLVETIGNRCERHHNMLRMSREKLWACTKNPRGMISGTKLYLDLIESQKGQGII
jgi:hypothetical protein